MFPEYEISLLLSLMGGFLFGFVAWGLWRVGGHRIIRVVKEVGDDLLLGLSVVAALALGGFVTYALLGL